jgi:hypothetical protein
MFLKKFISLSTQIKSDNPIVATQNTPDYGVSAIGVTGISIGGLNQILEEIRYLYDLITSDFQRDWHHYRATAPPETCLFRGEMEWLLNTVIRVQLANLQYHGG